MTASSLPEQERFTIRSRRGRRASSRPRLVALAIAGLIISGCGNPSADELARSRRRMVERHIAGRGISDPAVLAAMAKVPREKFVPAGQRRRAYGDHPLPIGERQTISQPYIVALMTDLAEIDGSSKVLEIGTGSGYQAAILAEIAQQVYTIEIIESLATRARATLTELGYRNLEFRIGDGYQGWPEEAPFDAILVTAAPPRIPEPLKQQLAIGGRLVLPVGDQRQSLRVVTRSESGFDDDFALDVIFVPMTGEAQER